MKEKQIFLLSSTIQNQRFFITQNDVTINNSIENGVVDMNARRSKSLRGITRCFCGLSPPLKLIHLSSTRCGSGGKEKR